MSPLKFIFLVILASGYAKVAPDFLHPCSISDAECILKAAREVKPHLMKGMPEFGLPTLDPFHIDQVEISEENFSFIFKNGVLRGLMDCEIDDIKIENDVLYLRSHGDINVAGEFEGKGDILSLSFNGAGTAKISAKNFILHLEVTLEHVKDEKGVDHLSIKDFKYTYEFGDNVSFDIKHLIKDNEKLSEELVKNMNENWKTFADILIVPILKYAVKKGMEVAGTLMSVIPSNEILLP